MKSVPPPSGIADSDILLAYEKAATQNILASLYDEVFFGHWNVCVDGIGHGWGKTYPSLDGHQMTDALLFLGEKDRVLANWDYVKGFQREDGHLPIGIFPDDAGKMLGHGECKAPVSSNGAFYHHWVPGDPLLALGGITYIQNLDIIFEHTGDKAWLNAQLSSVNKAADFVLSLTVFPGCIGGAGFYVERPTRIACDGVTQCYAADALRRLSRLNSLTGNAQSAEKYRSEAEKIVACFRGKFWMGDQFAEYIHPERGVIPGHGLTDVDWAAIACDIASPEQTRILWPRLRNEDGFYYGGMPCGIATRPDTYEAWEFAFPDTMDLAAMGRVWYLESWARFRMGDREGLLASLRRVIERGLAGGWYWRERYGADGQGYGSEKYCEYPANLIRIIHRFLADKSCKKTAISPPAALSIE